MDPRMRRPISDEMCQRRSLNAFEKAYNGYTPGTLFGILFLLITFAYISVEVSRIIRGSLNRNSQSGYSLYPGNIYEPPYFILGQTYNVERQHHYLWPWSNPALFFSIPLLLAALFGISAGRRGTYSMIYLFFSFSLITFCLAPFLIGYFSVNINRHNTGNTLWQVNADANRDRSLSIVMLALSLFQLLVSFLSVLVSSRGFTCCSAKGGSFLRPNARPDYLAR